MSTPTKAPDEELLLNDFKNHISITKLKRSNKHLKWAIAVLSICLVGIAVQFIVFWHRIKSLTNFNDPHQLQRPPLYYTVESLTRDVAVKQIHSHNDEWRRVPFFDALTKGSNSIEADVWLRNGDDQLLVGHNADYLKETNTLSKMYIEPLWNLLDNANGEKDSDKVNGIFFDSPETTTYFYIDVKADGVDTVKQLEEELAGFIERGYLSYFNETTQTYHEGPVSVIITGNYPYDYIASQQVRYFFIDAPLYKLYTEPEGAALYSARNVSLFASCSLQEITHLQNNMWNYVHGISDDGMDTLWKVLRNAQTMGLKTRVWDTPGWPVNVRHTVWKQLLQSGVDYLNVDDLRDAFEF